MPAGGPALALILALLATPAQAEPQILPPGVEGAAEMAAYARTEPYRKLLAGALARVPAAVVPRCPRLAVDDGAIIIQQKLQFGSDKAPVAGGWRHSQPTRGCGTDVLVNFFFFPTADRRIITVVGLPGTTRTDLTQQRTARPFVLLALNPVTNGCGQVETVNTQFGGFGTRTPPVDDPGAAAEYRPWWETWTMLGCGKHYTVPMNFTPNRLGLGITPGPVEPH